MTLIEYPDLEQGSPEWLVARLGLVTASVVGKLVTAKTLKPADNPESRGLVAALVAERITGWSDPTYMSDDMRRGHDVEPIARDWYAEREGVEVAELGFMVLERDGWRLGFSPDGLIGSDGLLEIKAPRAKTHLTTHLSGEVPSHHLAQLHAGMLVSGRSYCDFVSFYCGMPPFIKRVHADQRWQDAILAAVEKFEHDAMEMELAYVHSTRNIPTTERLLIDMEMRVA